MVDSRLTAVPVLEHRVGLRPNRHGDPAGARTGRRLDDYPQLRARGGGVTLSWGCAEEVRELVEKVRAT
jgi:D-amino-acid oxidase